MGEALSENTNNQTSDILPPSPLPNPIKQADSFRRVKILDDTVANQIAAGEVVERPASVVKELVENSLDAEATEISIVISNGGKSLIIVSDNGSGMRRDDALSAIERFGTSKLITSDDLENINTLGFRGEAIPSIASVSRFRLETATRENSSKTGTELFIEGGRLREVRDCSRNCGTTVEVKNLFFNTPARRKFLRSEQTEKGFIKSIIVDLALSRPDVRFRLVVDGQEELNLPPCLSLEVRARELKLLNPRFVCSDRSISGQWRVIALLSPPAESISSAGKLHLLVNGRAVRDSLIIRALREGYGNFLRPGAYPHGVLSLQLPPQDVDVNVHPRKAEVRFRHPDEVFCAISDSIRRSFKQTSPLQLASQFEPSAIGQKTELLEMPFNVSASSLQTQNAWDIAKDATSISAPSSGLSDYSPPSTNLRLSSSDLGRMRYLGQIFECYLLFEASSELRIIDMHAAHERIRFYQIKKQLLENGSLPSQLLLSPQVIEIDQENAENLTRKLSFLQHLGIDCESFGQNSLLIRGVPFWLKGRCLEQIFLEINALPFWSNWEHALTNHLDEIVARLACHSSVRSGQSLSREEAESLIAHLVEVDSSGLCPHGRPVMCRWSKQNLEQLFSR